MEQTRSLQPVDNLTEILNNVLSAVIDVRGWVANELTAIKDDVASLSSNVQNMEGHLNSLETFVDLLKRNDKDTGDKATVSCTCYHIWI
jgi:hypothetical protein